MLSRKEIGRCLIILCTTISVSSRIPTMGCARPKNRAVDGSGSAEADARARGRTSEAKELSHRVGAD